MIDHVLCHDLLRVVLLGLCVIAYWVWQRRRAGPSPVHRTPLKRTTRCSTDPKPFPGLTTLPRCEERLQAIWQATPLTAATGGITPNRRLVEVLVQP
jgi:hypothetical protein